MARERRGEGREGEKLKCLGGMRYREGVD